MQQLHPGQPRPLCPATVNSREDYRDDKLQRRRKYVFTDQIDRLIQESYLSHQDSKKRSGIPQLAKKVGMPHWALKKRARELGLARSKELPWSEAELGILSEYAWMRDERIRLKLKAAGYSRTVTGIHLKLERCDSSMTEASTPLTVWRKRWDRPSRRDALDQERTLEGQIPRPITSPAAERRQLPDPGEDVRRFIVEHPTDVDLRKVDQLWFLDVITNGLVRAA